MSQISLFDSDFSRISGLMPAIRAAMRRAAGNPDGEGRKALVDKINAIARSAEIRLTGGRAESISKDVLDKWLSPSDVNHPPSILALVCFCRATGNYEALRIILQAADAGLDIMTPEDRKFRDIGKADVEMKAARKRKRLLEERL